MIVYRAPIVDRNGERCGLAMLLPELTLNSLARLAKVNEGLDGDVDGQIVDKGWKELLEQGKVEGQTLNIRDHNQAALQQTFP